MQQEDDTIVSIAQQVELPDSELTQFCERWDVSSLAAFGSVLREDFNVGSDLDVLAEFGPTAKHSIFDLVRMEQEFAAMAGRPVDFIERNAIEQCENYLRRREILESAKVFYNGG